MCGVTNCPLAFRETLALRRIVNELTDGSANNGMAMHVDAGRLMYDVACAIGLDPWSVLNPAIMTRLLDEDVTRLWPTLTEAENAEMIELDNIREPDIPDRDTPISPRDRAAMYHFEWPPHTNPAA